MWGAHMWNRDEGNRDEGKGGGEPIVWVHTPMCVQQYKDRQCSSEQSGQLNLQCSGKPIYAIGV